MKKRRERGEGRRREGEAPLAAWMNRKEKERGRRRGFYWKLHSWENDEKGLFLLRSYLEEGKKETKSIKFPLGAKKDHTPM